MRPVVHVKDVRKAFISGIDAPKNILSGVKHLTSALKDGNYTVKEFTEVSLSKSGTRSELKIYWYTKKDSLLYKVSFDRIYQELGDFYKPSWSLDRGAKS